MKNKIILVATLIVLVVLITLGCIQYHKVNAEYQDYYFTEEKIILNHKHNISVGTMEFSNLSYDVKGKEMFVSMDVKIKKTADYKDKFYNNFDASLFLRVNDEVLQQTDDFKLKNGKTLTPDRAYFNKHSAYEGRMTFSYMPIDLNGEHDLELAYLDRDGHKLKKLYLPIKVDGGKIV
ncbi:hypothetical protein BU072_07080 [Mammaliicoccus vitulinus]|uniref:DUF4352 domain-containing protein n=1 Tax=Mammaliicoccus vitulinus TaxID=71237 RepID=A0A2T4PTB6_9STAP|nr:hypothetical protein [Mammaliicoccus vitulinus]PTI29601.1 hypothetical protein BU072_07080 [Mammaliicoccus vitulinus]